MRIRFFAQSRDAAGCSEAHLAVDSPLTTEELWDRLEEKFPRLATLRKTSRLARRETFLRPGERLEVQDEIAVIPAVSGG
jgi:molybdopterin converting factor subunit 1